MQFNDIFQETIIQSGVNANKTTLRHSSSDVDLDNSNLQRFDRVPSCFLSLLVQTDMKRFIVFWFITILRTTDISVLQLETFPLTFKN